MKGLETKTASEYEIQKMIAQERARLEEEAGTANRPVEHFHRPVERPFTREPRDSTTLLFGGLTWKHEALIHGALEGLGYQVEILPTPDIRAFQLGKEYGNNGQCNPTYFTVGNLVQFLQQLEEKGIPHQEILDRYVFVTAGSCGPCRFGMYEAEYRLALRNAGFDGFRILLFQQTEGLKQSEVEAGLELNLDFSLGILNAMSMGDLLNDVAYQIRPYEVNPGETGRVLEMCMDELHEVMKRHKPFQLEGKIGQFLQRYPKVLDGGNYIGKFFSQLYGDAYTAALRRVGERLNEIQVDRTRVKPIVKITGEFWAQTTEGSGNFRMFQFLEREGAQVLVEPVGTWIVYLMHQARQKIRDRKGLDAQKEERPTFCLFRKVISELTAQQKLSKLTLAEKIFKREWNRLREALGNLPHPLTDQYELQRLGHPFYNSRAEGGEGYLEVAKNIYYTSKGLCHMVLSLKPFGCMPSTQSDGVQSAVVSLYKDILYLPIETSGEGEVNAHSRVQMALGEARIKAKEEFQRVLEKCGVTLEEVRSYVDEHPELKKPFYKVPHHQGTVGVAANFVRHMADRMKRQNGRKPR